MAKTPVILMAFIFGTAILVCAAMPAYGHAFATRYDLPLPLTLFITGAGAAVVLSFFVVVLFVRSGETRAEQLCFNLLRLPGVRWLGGRVVQNITHVVSIAIFGLLIAAGLLGTSDPQKNILPTFVWIIWWVGMAFVSALVGDLWALVNPWKILFTWFESLFDNFQPLIKYPVWLGQWPAAALFLMFAWIELILEQSTHPPVLAMLIVIYTFTTLAGMALFGRDIWLKNGEVFSIFFGLFARFSPTGVNGTRWDLRVPAMGLLGDRPAPISAVCFVILLLTTVTFDGILETPMWAGILEKVSNSELFRSPLFDFKGTSLNTVIIAKSGALIAIPCIFLGIFCLFGRAMAVFAGGRVSTTHVIGYFVFSLIPIAIAYHISHFISYLLITGQNIVPLASDPFGYGWNIFGTIGYKIDISVINAKIVWYTALVSIVIGHVLAVYLAHVMAIRVFTERNAALRSQVPMLVLMVAYTMISLWVMSQPILA